MRVQELVALRGLDWLEEAEAELLLELGPLAAAQLWVTDPALSTQGSAAPDLALVEQGQE